MIHDEEDVVVWTPVLDILRNIEDSCDFGSAYDYDADDNTALIQIIITSKSADSGFGHLVESIMEHGFQEKGAIGWDGTNLQNGHHRFVAAVLLCLDKIPTVPYWGREWDDCPNPAAYNAHFNTDDEYSIEV